MTRGGGVPREGQDDGRRDVGVRYAVGLDEGAEAGGLEGGGYYCFDAAVEAAQDDDCEPLGLLV